MKRLALLIALCTTPVMAMATTTGAETAAALCPAEWSAVSDLGAIAWDKAAPIAIDPTLDAATTQSFNKYGAAVIAIADYFGDFLALGRPQEHATEAFDAAKAKFALAMCLAPTPEDRARILAFAAEQHDYPAEELSARMFEAWDQFACMRIDEASTQIFDLNPASPDFQVRFHEITQGTMKACG